MTTATLTVTAHRVRHTPGNDGFNSKPTSLHGQIHQLLLQDSVTPETPLTMSQIVVSLKLDKSKTKYNHLNDCKDRGWVVKVRGKDGKEGYILTDEGRKLLTEGQQPLDLTESNVPSEPPGLTETKVESEPAPLTEPITKSEPSTLTESDLKSESTPPIEPLAGSESLITTESTLLIEPTPATETNEESEPKPKKEKKPRTRRKKA